jgi:hypothetical protein
MWQEGLWKSWFYRYRIPFRAFQERAFLVLATGVRIKIKHTGRKGIV